MIMYLPEIYPDELVYSWFGRYAVHSGCLTHKTALRELLAKRSCNPSKEFIGHLNPEARRVIAGMYPMEQLVAEHTMYPQYARFLPSKQKKDALYRMANDFCDAHHLFAILPRCEKERYIKYCPLCAVEDRRTYGEAYWHRQHQIRNMRICPKHGCELLDSNVTAKSEQDYTLNPAEETIKDLQVIKADNPIAQSFAEYMASVFTAPLDFDDNTPIAAILYYAIRKAGYLSLKGKARYTALLTEDIRAFYEKIGLNDIASYYKVQRALLGGGYDFSVICQIAFYLGMKKDELLGSLTPEQIKREEDTHTHRGIEPVNWKQYDEEMAPVLEEFFRAVYSGTANETGRPERVSEKLLRREFGLTSYNLAHMPRSLAAFEKYNEPYGETFARRIIWAYQKLKKEKDTVYWTDIRRISGVKKKNFSAAEPYLEKYADRETVEEILSLV